MSVGAGMKLAGGWKLTMASSPASQKSEVDSRHLEVRSFLLLIYLQSFVPHSQPLSRLHMHLEVAGSVCEVGVIISILWMKNLRLEGSEATAPSLTVKVMVKQGLVLKPLNPKMQLITLGFHHCAKKPGTVSSYCPKERQVSLQGWVFLKQSELSPLIQSHWAQGPLSTSCPFRPPAGPLISPLACCLGVEDHPSSGEVISRSRTSPLQPLKP